MFEQIIKFFEWKKLARRYTEDFLLYFYCEKYKGKGQTKMLFEIRIEKSYGKIIRETVKARSMKGATRKAGKLFKRYGGTGALKIFPERTFDIKVIGEDHCIVYRKDINAFHANDAYEKIVDEIPENAKTVYIYCEGKRCRFNTRTDRFEDAAPTVIEKKFLWMTREMMVV